MTLSSHIKHLALELGFDAVGITRPDSLTEGERAIAGWVREGRHGGMNYLEEFEARKKRFYADFPDAKSVIVLGVNYYTNGRSHPSPDIRHQKYPPHPALSPSEGEGQGEGVLRGRVARYAWGRDYHEVIRERHAALIQEIQKIAPENFRAKSCVDTQPVPERFAAQRAGLGFLGKNTMLLSRKFGPWLFLSEIVTPLELEEDLPDAGDCGTCDRCQKICPTGALDEDYKIDARKCIAYLTIEHKGVIPRELRPKIKDWIFGCDECLTVCPFTSRQIASPREEFQPEQGAGPWLEMDKLFDVRSNREYEKIFAGSAVLRASRKQMLRNASIVLGNSRRPEALPYLTKALHDPAPLVRLHAAWGLGQMECQEARDILDKRYCEEPDPSVKEEIEFALAGQSLRPGV